MTKRILLFLIIAMVYSPFSVFGQANQIENNKPIKVLLLHSYAQNLSWTADENQGFFDVLNSSSFNFDVTVEYMDTKHYYSNQYYALFDELFAFKHKHNNYDLIAVTDDNALGYILSIKNDYFKDTPLFFCGSNEQIDYNLDQYNHVYGIQERASLAETMALISDLQPDVDTLYFLFDNSKTAQLTINDLKTQIEENSLSLNYKFLTSLSLDELSKRMDLIKNDKSAFIYGFYMTDISGVAFDPNDSAKRLVNSTHLPVYALWDFSMNTGALGGKLISGHEQGARMGELLIDYLNDAISSPLLDTSLGNTYKVDYDALMRFGFDETVLPKNTIILNRPETFFERHRSVIISASILTLLLIIYIGVLSVQIQRKTRTIETTTTQMMEYKRQASLSHLVKGVAHDINTPLGNIVTLTDFAKQLHNRSMNPDEKLISTLSRIEDSTSAITTVINRFKQVSIDTAQVEFSTIGKKNDNFSDAIKHIGGLILSEHNKIVELEVKGKKTLQFPMSDQHLYSILEPLICNSIDHGFIEEGFHYITITLTEQPNGIELLYEDNGIGIEPEHIDTLFEPFFSTAKHKKHSGLGLFSVYNTVTAYCGSIDYIQNEKTGATFLISLPFSCSII